MRLHTEITAYTRGCMSPPFLGGPRQLIFVGRTTCGRFPRSSDIVTAKWAYEVVIPRRIIQPAVFAFSRVPARF
jgi:hypothetical protein